MSITSAQDAAGAVTRTVIYADCDLVNTNLKLLRSQSPAARVIADLLGTPNETAKVPSCNVR